MLTPRLKRGGFFTDFFTDFENNKVNIYKFDEVDSLVSEIISRFGYEVYLKWNSGEITTEEITHYINAERAREAARMAEIESVIVGAIGSIFSKSKTTARKINEIIKLNQKIAKGES